jgi:putative hydrolase of the HAD superfamily
VHLFWDIGGVVLTNGWDRHAWADAGLRRYFRCFFSSCYFGVRKPDRKIYELALQVTQARPEDCAFIDDRPENLELARQLNMHAVRFVDTQQLRKDLEQLGIHPPHD